MRRMTCWRTGFYCLGLYLLAAPCFLLLGALSGIGPALLLPPLLALAAGALLLRLPSGRRLPAIGLSMAACFGLTCALGVRAGGTAWRWIAAAMAAVAAAVFPRVIGQVTEARSHAGLWYGGLAAQGAVLLLTRLLSLPALRAQLYTVLWVYVVYMVFALTLESVREGVGQDAAPSRATLAKNLAGAAVFACLLGLLTHLPLVARALRAVLSAVRGAVAWLLARFSRFAAPAGGGSGGGAGGGLGLPAEPQEPSLLARILEYVAIAVAGLALLAALAALLTLIFRALRRALRRLMARFRDYAARVNAYEPDQVESLLDWGEVRRSMRGRRERRRADRTPYAQLTPRQQVRRRYRDYLIRHPAVPPTQTARQTLPTPAQADIYEAARYSSRTISPEEVRVMDGLEKNR